MWALQDQSSNDEYLFDLDHFVSMAGEPSSDVDPAKLPPLPMSTGSNDANTDVHLVLDARLQGGSQRLHATRCSSHECSVDECIAACCCTCVAHLLLFSMYIM